MVSTIKFKEFFDPSEFTAAVHIIGVGAIGSHIAEQLARLGIKAVNIYDFDTVEASNVSNQMYTSKDIGLPKTEAIAELMLRINPDMQIRQFGKGYTSQTLKGHVFLCVDNIDTRRRIVEEQWNNPNILAMYDFRMGLTDAQHYAADWSNEKHKQHLLATMQFSSEEAKAIQPVSVCGTSLNILPTVRMITAVGVANFINHTKDKALKQTILLDAFSPDILIL